VAFDSDLLTRNEVEALRNRREEGWAGLLLPASIMPLTPFLSICALRTALLEIAHLPENRADEASVIALVALQPYLEEQRTRTKEQG
jgi:hypothetical protein